MDLVLLHACETDGCKDSPHKARERPTPDVVPLCSPRFLALSRAVCSTLDVREDIHHEHGLVLMRRAGARVRAGGPPHRELRAPAQLLSGAHTPPPQPTTGAQRLRRRCSTLSSSLSKRPQSTCPTDGCARWACSSGKRNEFPSATMRALIVPLHHIKVANHVDAAMPPSTRVSWRWRLSVVMRSGSRAA